MLSNEQVERLKVALKRFQDVSLHTAVAAPPWSRSFWRGKTEAYQDALNFIKEEELRGTK